MIPTTISFHDEITWKENDNVSTTTTTTSSTTTTTVLIGTTTVLQDFISNENTEPHMKELQLLEQKSILMAMLESITPTGTTTGTSTSTSTSTSSSSGCTSSFVVVDGGGSGNGANNSKNGSHQKLVLMCLPDHVTRNNHPWSVHTITEHLSKNIPPTKTKTTSRIIFCGSNVLDHVGALVTAVAKAFPVYSRKTSTSNDTNHDDNSDDNKSNSNNNSKERTIYLTFCNEKGQVQIPSSDVRVTALAAVEGIQLAARLVDMPPAELTTDVYAEICHEYAETLPGVTMKEIVAEELQQQGYGGIYGVGKAATCPPRLIIMEYTPPPEVAAKNNNNNNNNNNSDDDNNTHIALVGKAIVYDTGGLSLKPKVGMCGMKADMGGSAGLLGGFVATVKSGEYPYKLTLLLCMAENAIGPTAFRNDDILTLYSGKTVEINNCDAEGRLVLGDGVAHATKHIPNLRLVIDMATLTGAQLVATGKKHAGILTNQQELEVQAVAAGLRSGDLTFPLLYAPELLKTEFNSKVADMKNSVKDRSNAQTSCAGHFIESHIHKDYNGGWLHVDMAGPATNDERGTGYGVALVLSLLKIPGF